jgi:hypothetical protein
VHLASSLLALVPSNLLLFPSTAHCTALALRSMDSEISHDLHIADKPANDHSMSDSEVESAPATSSTPTRAAIKMVEGKIPEFSEFFKKTTVIEEERRGYHDLGWLPGNLISMIPEVDEPTIHDSTVICFESI